MIYFDNGATTYPKPRTVMQDVQTAFMRYGANPGRSGHQMAMDTAMAVYDTRETAARLFHARQPEDVVFCGNTTHAINLALKGALRPGDHVIISDLEHNAVLRPIHTLAQRGIITYSVAEVDPDSEENTVANFKELICAQTKMIACMHGSNVFGLRLPIEALGALAAEYDLLFLVDAAQTAGVLDIDMQACGIDFLCAAGHKSLYGPSGTGLLITPLGSALETIVEGGTGSFSADYDQPTDMPDRLECGTINTVGVIGLHAGMRFVEKKGCHTIYQHEMKIGKEIYDNLKQIPGVRLYTNEFVPGKHLPVISFNLGNLHSEEVGEMLSTYGIAVRAGLHCAPLAHKKMGTLDSGSVRISIGAFNTSAQAKQLCGAVKKIAAKHCNNTALW